MQNFHIFHKTTYLQSGLTCKPIRSKKTRVVYVSFSPVPGSLTASSLVANEPLFNLPARVAGGSGVVAMTTKTLMDSGCTLEALISRRRVQRLKPQVDESQGAALTLADGAEATVSGTVSARVKIG
jgi:hypothetical protein